MGIFQKIRTINRGIAYDIFIPVVAKKIVSGGLLLLPGIPGCPEKNSAAVTLSKNGFLVVVPQYTGTFDSKGVFNLKNCVDTAESGWKFVTSDKFQKKYLQTSKIKVKKWILAGNSFGGTIALLTKIKNNDLLLIAPAVPDYYSKKNLLSLLNFIKKNYPLTYRINKVENVIKDFSETNLEYIGKNKKENIDKRVFLIYGLRDTTVPPSLLSLWLKKKSFDKNKLKTFSVRKGNHESESLLSEKSIKAIKKLFF